MWQCIRHEAGPNSLHRCHFQLHWCEKMWAHTAKDKRIGNTCDTQRKRKSQRTCEEKQICVNEPFSMCVVHKQHGFQLLAAKNNNKISKFQCNHDHYHKYWNIVIHLCIKIHFYILPKFTIHTHARSHLSRILVTIETSPVSCCHAYSLSPVEISWTLLTFHRHFFNALVAYNWEKEKKSNVSHKPWIQMNGKLDITLSFYSFTFNLNFAIRNESTI